MKERIWLGFSFNLATFGSWRATTAAPAIPTIVFLLLAYLSPESPHFLLRKSGRKPEFPQE
jgi:hypothetical protein